CRMGARTSRWRKARSTALVKIGDLSPLCQPYSVVAPQNAGQRGQRRDRQLQTREPVPCVLATLQRQSPRDSNSGTDIMLTDTLRNNVKEKLTRGEVVASMTVRLVRQVEIAQIAKTAGFDTIYVDMEHCSASIETTSQICMAALAAGVAPFVRVPANTPEYITRVLEGGALGVIAPHIGSAEQARAVVQAAKFPPLGARSVAGGLPHLHFRTLPAAEAYAALNDATIVMVQFEN